MKLDMHPLLCGDTSELSFTYDLDVAEIAAQEGLEDCLLFADVTFASPIRVDGQVKNMAGYMLLTLEADVSYETVCARCAEPIAQQLSFRMEKDVADTKGDMRLEDESNDDYLLIEDGLLDVDAPVIDQLYLEFPMKHLCREDCRGLCSVCGKNLNEGECGCSKNTVDPRFAVLKKLLDEGAFSDEEHPD